MTFIPPGGIPPVRPMQTRTTAPATPAKEKGGFYDTVEISADATPGRRFEQLLVSRITQEVRTTAMPAAGMQQLSEQINRGEYQPDAARIAGRILSFEGE